MSQPQSGASSAPTYVYRYVVTASEVADYPVGKHLIDRRRERVKTWTLYDDATGDLREFTAERGPRCCGECYRRGLVRDHGHAGEHGETATYTPWVTTQSAPRSTS